MLKSSINQAPKTRKFLDFLKKFKLEVCHFFPYLSNWPFLKTSWIKSSSWSWFHWESRKRRHFTGTNLKERNSILCWTLSRQISIWAKTLTWKWRKVIVSCSRTKKEPRKTGKDILIKFQEEQIKLHMNKRENSRSFSLDHSGIKDKAKWVS